LLNRKRRNSIRHLSLCHREWNIEQAHGAQGVYYNEAFTPMSI
jgi:hypothetical protein